jgi:hypothetical protein
VEDKGRNEKNEKMSTFKVIIEVEKEREERSFLILILLLLSVFII